ncbi:MAG: B12-binding domain-containing radical SAM protein [Myxococcales bacterium]|nr:B12-binding domain-containing radical SAM protein [Myxococcales bacterium]
MKITLIHPPMYVNPKALTALRPSAPLGLAYIAASLEHAGHDLQIIDALAEAPGQTVQQGRILRLGLTPEQIVARIDADSQAVAVTNMWSFSWPVVRGLIQLIRKGRPELKIVCGGEHFNGLPEFSMQGAPIDYIVRGEGEETAVALFGAMDKGAFDPAEIAGVAWRGSDGRVVVNEPRARIKDVDEIPPPAWHLFDLDTYNREGMTIGIDYGYTIPILTTRGCPYSCTYCASPRMWTTRWYARSPKLVVDELEGYVQKYGANNFPMQDLTAILKKDWIISFCREIIDRGLDIRWQFPSGTRCEVIDDDVAPLLFQSGCHSMCYAPESGSDETRKQIKKKMKKEALFGAVDAAVKQKINLTAFIVIGFPHDKEENLRENLPFVRELARRGVEDIACGFFFPIPATELYDYLADKGKITLTDESLLAPILVHDRYLTPDRNFSDHLPSWKLTMYRYLILLNFYPLAFLTHPRRVVRILSNFVQGKEESKLESFLVNFRRGLIAKFRGRWGRS